MEIERTEYAIRRVRSLIIARFMLALFALGLLLVLGAGRADNTRFMYGIGLIGVTLVMNAVYYALLGRIKRLERFSMFQVFIDSVIVSGLVYLTGSANSIILVLYFAIVLGATILISPRGGIFFASLCTTMLAVIAMLYFFALHSDWTLPLVGKEFTQYYRTVYKERGVWDVVAFLVAEAAGLHTVALLGGVLAKSITQYQLLYEGILQHMGDGLIAISHQGRVIFLNEEARKILSYEQDMPVEGSKFSDLFRRQEEKEIHGILARRQEVDFELEVTMRDGMRKTINIKTSKLLDGKGRERGIVGIFTDLTAKKRIEKLERKAAKFDEMGELAAGIAHEVRNPLASISGAIQELGKLDIKGDDNKRLAEIVVLESHRLDGIISDFLQFARMQPPTLVAVDLRRLLDGVVLLLKSRPDAAGVGITWELSGDFIIHADAGQINQVFLNLGINALEALAGCGNLSISAEPTRLHGAKKNFEPAVSVTFLDSGKGMVPEVQKKIFTPFYTTKTTGTGMGLAIVERIVSSHRGSIDLVCELEKGCKFRVVLPLHPQEDNVG